MFFLFRFIGGFIQAYITVFYIFQVYTRAWLFKSNKGFLLKSNFIFEYSHLLTICTSSSVSPIFVSFPKNKISRGPQNIYLFVRWFHRWNKISFRFGNKENAADVGAIHSVIREISQWKQHTYGLLHCLDEKVLWPRNKSGRFFFKSSLN